MLMVMFEKLRNSLYWATTFTQSSSNPSQQHELTFTTVLMGGSNINWLGCGQIVLGKSSLQLCCDGTHPCFLETENDKRHFDLSNCKWSRRSMVVLWMSRSSCATVCFEWRFFGSGNPFPTTCYRCVYKFQSLCVGCFAQVFTYSTIGDWV